MKTPRIYEELAAVARARGYARVTAAAIHDWRKRDLLPRAKGVTRRPHTLADLPKDVVERVLALCRYRYEDDVRDLRIVGLLLWLDGQAIRAESVRLGLSAVGSIPLRLVTMAGSRARAAYPDDADADVQAAAAAVDRNRAALEEFSGRTSREELDAWAGAYDALMVAVGRMAAANADSEALSNFAQALGLDRATSESAFGAEPWLKGKSPGDELIGAISTLFGPRARAEIEALHAKEFAEIREIANDLTPAIQLFAEMMSIALPKGAIGLGFLTAISQHPVWARPLIAYAASRNSGKAREFRTLVSAMPLDEWREALELAHAYIGIHPEIQSEIAEKGLVQILEERGALSDN
jgi:hypothetical protein